MVFYFALSEFGGNMHHPTIQMPGIRLENWKISAYHGYGFAYRKGIYVDESYKGKIQVINFFYVPVVESGRPFNREMISRLYPNFSRFIEGEGGKMGKQILSIFTPATPEMLSELEEMLQRICVVDTNEAGVS